MAKSFLQLMRMRLTVGDHPLWWCMMLYHTWSQTWDLDCGKTSGLAARESIGRQRALSRWKSKFATERGIFSIRITCLFLLITSVAVAQTLTFEEAMQRTLSCSPELQISAADAQQRAGDWFQTQAYPNPEFCLNVNNTPEDQLASFQNTTYEISQTIEWMPKRWAKQKAAKFDYYASCTWHERARLAVLNRLVKAFVIAMAAQEELELAKVRREIAESALQTVTDVTEAGKGSGIQINKAEVELALAEVELQKAELEFFGAKEHLVLSWGASCPDFETLSYEFYNVAAPPAVEVCCALLDGHPEYRAVYYRYLAAENSVRYERNARIPDVTVSLGYETAKDPHDRAVAFGLTVPIPVWDQNRGNIYRAKSEKLKLCELCHLRRALLRNKQAVAHHEVTKAFREVQLLKDTALAMSEKSFELAREGFLRGKFQYLDMLDSQRTLFEVRDKYIRAVLKYHVSKADLDYLVTDCEG